MKRYTFIIIAVFSFLFIPASGQTNSKDLSSVLESLYKRILNTNSDNERIRLNDSVQLIIDAYAASDSVFKHKFSNLRYLGQISSPDSKLKIITWNLILREGGNKYFFYLITKSSRKVKNKVYKLTGENREEPVMTDRVYTDKDWYGALYYTIQPFKTDKKIHYLLLGIDYGNTMTSRKIIDVLTITPEGGIIFGENCFVKENDLSYRVVIEYSSEAVVTLRLNNPKSVVFDHLASISDDKKSDPEFLGSEYRFDGYVLKNGFWRFVTSVDVRNKK